MDSILNSIKKLLGIQPEYTNFDGDLILNINTALAILTQLGVGPANGFIITDDSAEWTDFIGDDSRLELVKTYVHLKVKMLFDTPDRGNVAEAYTKLLDEMEFRLMVTVDEKRKENSSKWNT